MKNCLLTLRVNLSTLFVNAEVSYFLWMCETSDSVAAIGSAINYLHDKQLQCVYDYNYEFKTVCNINIKDKLK